MLTILLPKQRVTGARLRRSSLIKLGRIEVGPALLSIWGLMVPFEMR